MPLVSIQQLSTLKTVDCIHPHVLHGEPLGIFKFLITFHSSFSLLRFEGLSHYFNRPLLITCRLWVELISDLVLFGTSLSLPLEHERSISCVDTFYHDNILLLPVSLTSVLTSKASDANKNAILLYYSVYAVPFTKGILLEIKEMFLHPLH